MKQWLEKVFESELLSRDTDSTSPDACADCGGASLPGAVRCVDCLDS